MYFLVGDVKGYNTSNNKPVGDRDHEVLGMG
jgi:hypothetical protein